MAREILFKAKRIDNGEWVEGLLWKKKYQSNKWYISCFPDKDDHEEVYVVDSNTICQYTGLTDKNGNKIWENDFVELNEDVKKIFDVENGQVRYYRGTFIIGGKNELSGSLFAIADIFGVLRGSTVGNIFDNPELLEGTPVNGYADQCGLMSAT